MCVLNINGRTEESGDVEGDRCSAGNAEGLILHIKVHRPCLTFLNFKGQYLRNVSF